MFRTFLLLVLTSISLLPVNTYGQNNTRPNIVVPNGFEVNSYTGNLYHSRTDLRIPGQGLTIDISFSYNVSRRSRNRGFGKGWTFTYNMAYVIETDGIRVERPDGRSDLYRKSGATYLTPKGLFDALVEYQTGKFYIETKEGLRYYFDNATHKRMTKMQETNGNLINLAYTDTLLNTITDAAGHSLAFTWSNGLLSEIADNSCTPSRKISYDYDTKGNPVKVINPVGDQVQYYYDPTAKIIGYTDAAGNNMSIVYNSNSAVLKVASCATTHVFSYVPQQSKTYVTEQVNSQKVITTYTFDTQGRIASKKGNCCGFNVDYTYDTENNVISRRDGNNKQNAYEYDSKGNVTKETDATGNSTTYTYEPTHNKVASITDKNGNTTTYQYNAAGNLIQVNKPLSVTEKHTYDAKGNRLTDTDGNNNVTSYEYNNNGYLTKVTDAAGGITTFTYDCHGNRLSETDARNHTTTFQYNGINQLITKTDALGNLTTYTYDKLGGLVSLTNALGKKTQYIYDGLGRRISTILPAGNATYTAYDEQGNISKETNGNGQSITYTYNNRKQPLTITDALGNVMSYEYDEAGNKLRETDKNGNTTRFEYDDLYRLLKRTNALGGTTTYSYDAVGNRIAEVDANGNATTFQYDALRRLAKVTDALNKSITYTYDQNGNRLTEKDKAGNVTTYTYDKLNRVKTITDALNGVTTYTYDANGNMLIETDPLNHSITHTYDALNRQITSANALNEITTYTYDAIGNNKTIVKANGNTITNTYDDNSRLLTQSDDIGAIITYTYDNNDNTISRKDAGNHITTYQYDAANRPTKITFPNNTTFQFSYDAYGNKIKEINQSGDSTVFSYDKLNRTASIKDALGHISRFTYDAQGNLTNLIDAKGNTTSYSYDIRNKIAKQTYSDGSSKIFAYDANGLLISRTTGNGIQTQYKYDKLNRLTERQYPGNISDLFSYDAAGRMLTAINTNATVSFEYDAPGRVTKENLNGVSTTYTYSIANRTKTINYPGGMQILWQADKRERLIGINEGGNSLVTFQYNINDQLVNKQYRNTTSTDYTYDSMGNLTSLVSIPNTILNMNYQYDNSDNRTVTQRINKPAFSEQYTYDKLFQLSSFKSGQYANGVLTPTGTQEFSYDALGNRISTSENQLNKTYTVNNVNQYTSILTNGSNDPPAYDLTGNITSDGLNSYTYDTENRLLSIQKNTGTITYKYDALGRRISREKNGTVKLYFYSQNEVIEERVNSAIKSFIYGAGIDNILFAKTTTASYFYHTDDLNSVHALTDASGTLIEYYTYDPFGNPHVFNAANVELTTSSINNLLFTGREYDFDYKVYNYRSRDMNPSLGRFAQRDPLEYVDGLNNYAYVNNNVINNTDPLGLVRVWGVVGAVGGIIGNGIGFAGSVIFGVVTSPTVGGAAVGVAGAGYFGYGVFANAENLAAAWADEDPLSTGGALGDGAKEFFPCNETLQALGEAGDFLLGLANPSQIARGIGRLGNAIDEAGGLAGIAGKGADWLSNAASRGAGLLDDALTRGSGLVDNIVGRIKGNPSVGNEVTSGGTDLARKLGKAGEEAVGTIGPKTRIPSATGTAQYRIPDQLTSTSLIEVKNVEHLGLTAQIKDFYIYSQQTGREFIIYTRPNTTFSKPLQDLINQGTIVVKPIPFR